MTHWHRPDRTKSCISCDQSLPLASFYSYEYTTGQGKRSRRYESRCVDCAKARRRPSTSDNYASVLAASTRWKNKNRERLSAYAKERQKDPEYKAMKAKHQRIRGAAIRGRGDRKDPAVRAIYEEAVRLQRDIEASPCPVFDLPELTRKVHVDHIHPIIKGGRHDASNLQPLPAGLNMRKGTRVGSGL